MKLNQLLDDAAQKFVVARAVNFEDFAKGARLQAQFSQLRTQYNDYIKQLNILMAKISPSAG